MTFVPAAEPNDAAAKRARREAAYEKGRREGRADASERALLHERDTAVRKAYDRGRRDERARRPRHHGSPFLTLILLLVAAAGAVVVYLGVSQGSFARGGQVVDQNLQQATRSVANRAGDALQNAGQKLKQTPAPNS